MLDGALLANSSLRDVNACGASLVGADLTGANLSGVFLGLANLSGATIDHCVFAGGFLLGTNFGSGE